MTLTIFILPDDKCSMKKQPTILVLTSKTGRGHVSLAEAVRDRTESDYAVVIDDPQPKVFHIHYRLASRYVPSLWDVEYKFSNNPTRSTTAQKAFAILVERKITELLHQHQPDIIINTYSFFSFAIANAIKKLPYNVPFIQLLSDPLDVHSSWLTIKTCNAIFVPTAEAKEQAIAADIAVDKLFMTGWPVRNQFSGYENFDRVRFLNYLNLNPNHLTLFIQGGGEGTSNFSNTVTNLLSLNEELPQTAHLQIILSVGTNELLKKRFQNVQNIYVLPFTQNIAPYMATADVVMGKAGPNTLFESVTLEKPFIATTFVPGQEEPNLQFIMRYNLGLVLLDPQEQKNSIKRLLVQREFLNEKIKAVAAYRRLNAEHNLRILPLINYFVQKNKREPVLQTIYP